VREAPRAKTSRLLCVARNVARNTVQWKCLTCSCPGLKYLLADALYFDREYEQCIDQAKKNCKSIRTLRRQG